MLILGKVKKAKNPYRVVVASYAIAILIGTLLLAMPFSNKDGEWHLGINAIFLAANAISVTGLDPISGGMGNLLAPFGFVVTLILAQIGGLGIMTISSFVIFLISKHLSANVENLAAQDIGESHGEILKMLITKAIKFTLISEGIGTILLTILFYNSDANLSLDSSAFHGLFFSVMAFCNAGISLYHNSIGDFISSPAIQLVFILLATTGGIGFIVISELTSKYFFSKKHTYKDKLSLHTKTIIITTLAIIITGTLLILLLEYNGKAFSDAGIRTWYQKLLSSLFHVSQSRNAGFSTIPTSSLTNASIILTMCVMFIGAAPGSTAGGIKVTSLAIMIATIRSQINNRKETVLFERTINSTVVRDTFIIFYLYIASLIIGTFCLAITEQHNSLHQLRDILFEVLSALTTTGLSTGITPHLTGWSKLCIVVCMFIGRLGPITIVMLLAKRNQQYLNRFPEEHISVG